MLFDLDGTLVDSAPDIHAALNRALGDEGITPASLADVKSMVGSGARRLVECALGQDAIAEQQDRVLAGFLAAYRTEPATLTRLYPGVQAALMRLGNDGVKLAVATNKPHDLAVAILDAVGIATRFGVIVGSVPGLALKPDPAILRKALTELGGTPNRAVMVGDSRADVGAAKAARCRSIVFGHGYSQHPVSTLGADAVCSGFADLPGLVARLLPV